MGNLVLYPFGVKGCFPNTVKAVVGGKGAALHEMAALGLPVPPGIVIPTAECRVYLNAHDKPHLRLQQLAQLADQVIEFFQTRVEPVLGHMPLLSVRSGARVSMPGMMDTLLNVGITKANYPQWELRLGKAAANECSTRLIDTYRTLVGHDLPETLHGQLMEAIGAVFRSWNGERAKEYRRLHGYPDDWGTAVTVQAMVFGNVNDKSCSGVLFTRDPATGENVVTGEFLPKAQGEDVVAGIRTPRPLHMMEQWNPKVLDRLLEISEQLESHYEDMQDIEFTVQNGKLYVLQTRNAKRTALAAFTVAHDMAVDGMISKAEATRRVTAEQYQTFQRSEIDPTFNAPPLCHGLAASPGVATGRAVFDLNGAGHVAGEPFILIRTDTSPDDFPAMVQSAAILTSTGGATSHAAVVARGINKPAVVGTTCLKVEGNKALVIRDGKVIQSILAGDLISLCGATGRVWLGAVPMVGGVIPTQARTVLRWAQEAFDGIVAYEVPKTLEIPEAGRYYLNVSGLTKKQEFRALLKKMAQFSELSGVIGFARPNAKLTQEDQEFLSLLKGAMSKSDDASATSLAALDKALLCVLPKKVKKRWVVHLPLSTPDGMVDAVVGAEWGIVRPVRTLKDLLAANGYVQFADDFRARMSTEKVKIEEVVALLKQAGRTVKTLGAVVASDDFVSEVLGK